jgi:hypothetical protein
LLKENIKLAPSEGHMMRIPNASASEATAILDAMIRDPEFLLEEEASELLRTPANTLRYWRTAGVGPRYFRPAHSRRVLYRREDLLEWIRSGERNPGGAA